MTHTRQLFSSKATNAGPIFDTVDVLYTATTLCYFPVTSGFCRLLNQSINQSTHHTLLFSSYFWILCTIESINQSNDQSINQSINQVTALCYFPVTSGFCVLLKKSINQLIDISNIRSRIQTVMENISNMPHAIIFSLYFAEDSPCIEARRWLLLFFSPEFSNPLCGGVNFLLARKRSLLDIRSVCGQHGS